MRPASEPRKRSPDSMFWDTVKGKSIEVRLLNGSTLTPKLLWVDRYTIGVVVDGCEVMLFKHDISTVRKYLPKE